MCGTLTLYRCALLSVEVVGLLFCLESKDDADDADQPLYMCIKIGKKFNLVPGHGGSFVRTRLKAEYWFNIPPDRYTEV